MCFSVNVAILVCVGQSERVTLLTRTSVCCVGHAGTCAWVAVWVYVMCVGCYNLVAYDFVDMCVTDCVMCAVCDSGVCVTQLMVCLCDV